MAQPRTDAEWDKALGITPTPEPELAPEFLVQEQTFHAGEVIRLMQADMNFLAGIVLPHVFTFLFPPVFLAVWAWVVDYLQKPGRHFPQLALGLPRGFGKTTVMKLLLVFVILFTKRRFILIVSETEKKAINIITDVMNMLSSPNMIRLFGDWKLGAEMDQQALKKFGFRGRNIIIYGIGVCGPVRGSNLDNARPDFMLFDDIQSREAANSDVETKSIEDWFFNTCLKSKDPMGCVYLFVANMYPTPNSMLRKLKSNHTWIKFIAGGILENGESLWEDLQPIDQLLDEFERDLAANKPEAFYSEVMNDETVNLNTRVDITKIPNHDLASAFISGSFIIIDPATGQKGKDDVSIGGFSLDTSIPVLHELEYDAFSPGDTIRNALKMAFKIGATLILIEGTAYQATLCYWFEQVKAQIGITGIHCLPIFPRGGSKNKRIGEMFKQLVSTPNHPPEIGITENVRSSVLHQVSQFNALRTDNTDGILDLLTYAPRALAEYGEYISIQNPLDGTVYEDASSLKYSETANSPF